MNAAEKLIRCKERISQAKRMLDYFYKRGATACAAVTVEELHYLRAELSILEAQVALQKETQS